MFLNIQRLKHMHIFKRINKSTKECLNIFVALKSNKYFCEWINWSINIHIYSNIRIFARYYIEVLNFNKISIFSTKISEKTRYRWLLIRRRQNYTLIFEKMVELLHVLSLLHLMNVWILFINHFAMTSSAKKYMNTRILV